MRLLSTADSRTFKEVVTADIELYAILSHCWIQGPYQNEVSYQQLLAERYSKDSLGWQKIAECCSIAKQRKIDWVWIDTCCIDKSSSAELSETINSMYGWYERASECYVFLHDFYGSTLPPLEQMDGEDRWKRKLCDGTIADVESFVDCRWFKRGWTLQELLAPRSVIFFNSKYEIVGTRSELAGIIAHATNIDVRYLTRQLKIKNASIAERMSWACGRATTRPEDMAYSLLGIFDVNIPPMYGEGERAFLRLQLEIIKQSDDESIFAWDLDNYNPNGTGILAQSPNAFSRSRHIRRFPADCTDSQARFMSTNKGIEFRYRKVFLIMGLMTLHFGHGMGPERRDERDALSTPLMTIPTVRIVVDILLFCEGYGGQHADIYLHLLLKDNNWYRIAVKSHKTNRIKRLFRRAIATVGQIHTVQVAYTMQQSTDLTSNVDWRRLILSWTTLRILINNFLPFLFYAAALLLHVTINADWILVWGLLTLSVTFWGFGPASVTAILLGVFGMFGTEELVFYGKS